MREPLVLIHGFTDTTRTWDPLLAHLEPHHELIVPTLVGHRGGPPVPEDLPDPIAAMADGVERAMREAGHERAHLHGNSLGGWLAFVLAHRGRALSVVASAPGHGWPGDVVPDQVRRSFARAHRLAPLGARYVRRIVTRPRLRRIALRDVIAHPERVPPATAAELVLGAAECPIFEPYAEQIQAGEYRHGWPDLDVPVRIAWGTRDRTLPLEHCSAYFREALPAAEWVELPGCGHLPHHDDPALVARTVLEVTRRSPAAPAPAASSGSSPLAAR